MLNNRKKTFIKTSFTHYIHSRVLVYTVEIVELL